MQKLLMERIHFGEGSLRLNSAFNVKTDIYD